MESPSETLKKKRIDRSVRLNIFLSSKLNKKNNLPVKVYKKKMMDPIIYITQ